MLLSTPLPGAVGHLRVKRFLPHGGFRLTCDDAGYAPLWAEQVGDAWREPSPPKTWPVLGSNDPRWAVRAAIDAVVADGYGPSRDQYAHVLSTFRHSSYPKAPDPYRQRFDELKAIGLKTFAKKHDPYVVKVIWGGDWIRCPRRTPTASSSSE